ncbi:hypothetical protein [Acidisoma silvae]|uniref:Uncharacterized protein n=1 Tax=Acidisoma silvae TaxID=2802396 RepID=A0A963YNW2_9PROT|nr:hypothetical protein [Acidisoma silvae]MCB8873924.1 hypothetical protein [Acidisoma silvae]
MTQDEITAWALANGWQMIAGNLSLTKPPAHKEAIVRIVLKTTVANLEVKKLAGNKWDKIAGAAYAAITPDEEDGPPRGLGFESIPSFSMLMQSNKDAQMFAKLK